MGNWRNKIGTGWEKVRTLVPGVAMAVWELTLKFPEFLILILELVLGTSSNMSERLSALGQSPG